MFGASPPLRDDAVHLVTGLQVLAQEADRDLRDRHGVGGVDPELGSGRGVRLRGRCTCTPKCATALTRGSHVLERCRVHHHRGVDAGERAPFEQEDLAAAAFLGGRADHTDA